MTRTSMMTTVAIVVLGCGPSGGSDDDGDASADGSTGTTGNTGNTGSTASASSTGTTTNGGTTTDTLGTSSASSGDESSTGSMYPAACVAQGWDDSLATFTEMSAASNGTYYYVRPTGGGGFKGQECNYETTIEAAAGIVVRRSFAIAMVPDGWTEADCAEQPFEENEASLGSHSGPYVPPPYSMEELYDGCCDLLALEPAEEYSLSFGVDGSGIVSSCSASLANCADGCEVDAGGFTSFYLLTFAFGMQ